MWSATVGDLGERLVVLRTQDSALAAGARHVTARRPMAAALATIGAHRFFYGISTIATLLLYATTSPTTGCSERAAAGSSRWSPPAVAGSVLAALVKPAIVRRWSTRRWMTVLFSAAGRSAVNREPFADIWPLRRARTSISRVRYKPIEWSRSAVWASRQRQ